MQEIDETIEAALARRMGESLHAKRRQGEHDRIAEACRYVSPKFTYLKIHVIRPIEVALLKAFGVYRRGLRNFLDVRVVENDIPVANLPEALDGFSILHLSDLHIDIDPAIVDAVSRAVKGVACNVCVLTGDYMNLTVGDPTNAIALMSELRKSLPSPAYAVLGNHDTLDMVVPLENAGYRILLNEHVVVRRGDDTVVIAGVDDPYIYQTHSIGRAMASAPHAAARILLSHSPVIHADAAAAGFDVMLCGHTHGGQVCLPGGFPILNNDRSSRRFISGRWTDGHLQGYTSRGTGGCGLPVRYFCPAEVTIHRLRRKGGKAV